MVTVLPTLLISVGASIVASLLLKKKTPSQISEGPTPLAKRGTYLPYLIGTRKLGQIFAYVGIRRVVKEKVSGGKGSLLGGGKQEIFYEQGWHLLCMPGPAARLHQIQQGGKTIFKGPITPASHPSGSTINIGKEGSFIIYWGGSNQPVNTQIQTILGINSRWPYMASIYWNDKRLGSYPQWPILTYEFECGLNYSLLTQSDGYKEPSRWPSNVVVQIDSVDNAADKFTVLGNYVGAFPTEAPVDVAGNAGGDAQFTVHYSVLRSEATGVAPFYSVVTYTDIYTFEGFTGYNDAGTLQPYVTGNDSGYNPAHILAQLLFAPYPHGRGISTDEFNIDNGAGSLEALGVRLQNEGMWGSLVSRDDGSDLEQLIAGLLLDIGVFISLIPRTGLWDFIPIRESGDVVPNFSEDFFVDPEPETQTDHTSRESEKVLYSFEDVDFNYKDNTVGGFDNDGEFRRLEYARSKTVQLLLPTLLEVAGKMAERRSQEDLGKGSAYKLFLNRGARLLMPGTQFTTAKTPERLLCVSKKLNVNSSKVEVSCIADFLSSSESSYEHESGAPTAELLPPVSPPVFGSLEVPRYLSQSNELLVLPVVRAHSQILNHTFWISTDDATYRQVLQTSAVQTGGALSTAIPADSDTSLGGSLFQFSPLGPDLSTLVLDLSGDAASFRSGRQVLLINDEIMFLDGVVASGGNWFLGKLIRARYGTVAQAHAVNDPFVILEPTEIERLSEPEFVPGATIYSKAQANASSSIPLSDAPKISTTLVGAGFAPLPPLNLGVRAAAGAVISNSYSTGGSPEVCWSYHGFATVGTGAGMQPAGNPHSVSPVAGNFRIEFLTSGGLLRGTYSSTSTSLSYSNASMISDFGSEPSSFLVRVTHTETGYESDYIETLVTKE